MSKPRICKSCHWLHNRAEPCWSCQRWGKGKTDHYISAEETLGEYLERKEQEDMEKEKTFENLSTDELIKSLRICGDVTAHCVECAFRKSTACEDKLKNAAVDRLEQLQQELIDERDRYDRLVSFELDEAEILRAAKGFVGACVNRVFFTDEANETEKIGVFQLLKADCTSSAGNKGAGGNERSVEGDAPYNGNICATDESVEMAVARMEAAKANGITYAEQLQRDWEDTSSAPAGHLEVNCPAGAREATLGCPLEGKANGDDTVRRCAEYVAEKRLQMDDEPPGKHKTQVICISGKAQHGKDTTAQFIKEYLEEHGKSVIVMHYSDLLKFIVRTYFGWNGEKDEDGRALLQYVGTDRIRSQSPDYWTDFAVGLIEMFPDEWDYAILADCRFPNEVECFKNTEFDTFHLRVIRAPFVSPLTPEQQLHLSETALDGVKADDYLLNTGTLEEYRKTVCTWLTYRDAMNREG